MKTFLEYVSLVGEGMRKSLLSSLIMNLLSRSLAESGEFEPAEESVPPRGASGGQPGRTKEQLTL